MDSGPWLDAKAPNCRRCVESSTILIEKNINQQVVIYKALIEPLWISLESKNL